MAGWAAICCAIDFSDASRFAMEEAADLARAFEAERVVIHVHDPGPRIEAEVVEWSRPPFALAAVDLERDICAWRREAERRSGSKVCSVVLEGEPATEITRLARERGVGILVIGKHGRTCVERFVLGSVAEKLVQLAPCPVLVACCKELGAKAYGALPLERSGDVSWPRSTRQPPDRVSR